MRATPAAIENAVLRLFAEAGVEPGASLRFHELQEGWPRMRFRRGDLASGVRQLVFSQHLRLAKDGSDSILILTESGYRRIQQLPPLPPQVLNGLASTLMRRLTPEREEPAGPNPGRRRDDAGPG